VTNSAKCGQQTKRLTLTTDHHSANTTNGDKLTDKKESKLKKLDKGLPLLKSFPSDIIPRLKLLSLKFEFHWP